MYVIDLRWNGGEAHLYCADVSAVLSAVAFDVPSIRKQAAYSLPHAARNSTWGLSSIHVTVMYTSQAHSSFTPVHKCKSIVPHKYVYCLL